VLAPSGRRREEIVPVTLPGRKAGKQPAGSVATLPDPEAGGLGTIAALVRGRNGKPDSDASTERERERERQGSEPEPFRWRRRYPWAELMKRVFLVDVLTCPECTTDYLPVS
jgi:hypothetical protein